MFLHTTLGTVKALGDLRQAIVPSFGCQTQICTIKLEVVRNSFKVKRRLLQKNFQYLHWSGNTTENELFTYCTCTHWENTIISYIFSVLFLLIDIIRNKTHSPFSTKLLLREPCYFRIQFDIPPTMFPLAPDAPLLPGLPFLPLSPLGPCSPGCPCSPVSPWSPCPPGSPRSPLAPGVPGEPRKPLRPLPPYKQERSKGDKTTTKTTT